MHSPHQPSVDHAEILALLRHHFADQCNDLDAIQLEGPTNTTRYSRVFRALIPGLSTPLVVKCLVDPATGEPDRASARIQFNVLDRVHRATRVPDPVYRVPEPYFLAEPEGIFAAEWFDGRPMTQLFLSRNLKVEQGRDLFRRAAAWIRYFSALRSLPPAPLETAGMLTGIDAMEHSRFATNGSARAALEALRKHADAAGGVQLERSWLHGDFKMDNLLVDDTSTVGIDMYARHENSIAHDLASFVNHWELTLCDPRAWRWRRHREEFSRAFLDAFDPSYEEERQLPYRWIALYEMLGVWDEFTRRRQRTLRHVYLATCFRHIVHRMTGELLDAATKRAR